MKPLIAIVGTTASGKSDLGVAMAAMFNGEVVSADSRQVYRHLDLGTGKITPEETRGIPHHLLDILDVNQPFSMADYQTLAYQAIDGIHARGKLPFLVGGTGLYTRSVIEGYCLSDVAPDEAFRAAMAGKTKTELLRLLAEAGVVCEDTSASERRLIRLLERVRGGDAAQVRNNPRYRTLQLGVTFPREVLNRRIEERLDRRLEAGMVEEVRSLMKNGATTEFLLGLGLEYRFTCRYLTGEIADAREYREQLLTEIRQFAKRQMTWFRKEKDIVWLDGEGNCCGEARERISAFLQQS